MLACEAELIAFLTEHLRIEVRTSSDYTGALDGGPLYRDCRTVQLVLCGKVISECAM